MPRNISPENLAAMQQGRLVFRDFMTIKARDRTTGNIVLDNVWSDYGNVSAQIIDPDTGLTVSRDWYGSGTLINIDDIPMTANLQVQSIGISVGQINAHIENLLRGYDLRQAPVEIYRGFFNPSTRVMVAPAEARWLGFVDGVEIDTPSENQYGDGKITSTSNTQEITRANSQTRSDSAQTHRLTGDTFYKDSATVGSWKLWWGNTKGKTT
jgi:hypothetical protein